MNRGESLRYGENPHQQAALYLPAGPHARGIAQAEQVQGKELSYNNYNDADAALELVAEFRDGPPACVIVKHANPCGVATGATLARSLSGRLRLRHASRRSAASSRSTGRSTAPTAEAMTAIFTEVVIAPDADEAARAIFAAKKNLRLLLTGDLPDPARPGLTLKSIAGGLLRPDARQRPGRPRRAQGRDQARSRPSASSPTACSPGRSPSTSSRTRSSTPRTAPPPASARAR